jgi:hypothetical protein
MFLKLVFASAVCSLGVGAQTYKASFTEYGSGDQNGSGNCNTDTTACGFYTDPGYSAAASQNLYGAGPGEGAGPACGTCYRLTIETDSSGRLERRQNVPARGRRPIEVTASWSCLQHFASWQ